MNTEYTARLNDRFSALAFSRGDVRWDEFVDVLTNDRGNWYSLADTRALLGNSAYLANYLAALGDEDRLAIDVQGDGNFQPYIAEATFATLLLRSLSAFVA